MKRYKYITVLVAIMIALGTAHAQGNNSLVAPNSGAGEATAQSPGFGPWNYLVRGAVARDSYASEAIAQSAGFGPWNYLVGDAIARGNNASELMAKSAGFGPWDPVVAALNPDTAVAASAAEPHGMKTGKLGRLTLKQNTRVGDTVLAPGYYFVQHRHTSSGHFVEFTYMPDNRWDTEGITVIDIPCKLEALNARVARTAAEVSINSKEPRLSKLEIRGESAAHLFDATAVASRLITPAPQGSVEFGGGH